MERVENADVLEVVARVRAAVPTLAREAMKEYARDTPRYAEFGEPVHLQMDSVDTAQTVMRTVLDSVVSDHDPSGDIEAAVNEVALRGVERAAERVPLRDYLRAWNAGFDSLARAVAAEVNDAGLALHLLTRMRRTQDVLLRRAADTYVTVANDLAAASSRQDSELLDSLFSDTAPLEDSPVIAAGTTVVHLRIGTASGEGSENPETSAVTRYRKIRQVRAHLFRELPTLLLLDVTDRYGRMLLSAPLRDPDAFVRELASTVGASVTIASEAAETREDLPRASRTASAALNTAERIGAVGQHVRMRDVALEHQLSYPTVALDILSDRCRPILQDDTLRHTVVSFMANDLDRRTTADDLFVHPNTVDNRLARIQSLTGLSVRRTRDLVMIAVAVTANCKGS